MHTIETANMLRPIAAFLNNPTNAFAKRSHKHYVTYICYTTLTHKITTLGDVIVPIVINFSIDHSLRIDLNLNMVESG